MMAAGATLDFRRLWVAATPYARFADEAQDLRGLWEGMYRRARPPEWALDAARARGSAVHLLVIAEDWCWDAANTVPPLARLADEAGTVELRIISRDQHPEVMDRYLTEGTRSIPIIIALSAGFEEIGHWGPRPAELQAWAKANKGTMEKKEFYAEMRRWHVRDGGESTLREVLALL
ncbi:MAG: thioredoxin family protein [Gemmatimonadota bacterium]|nr:MAG: thioredoxin family protein [Gemmatimonadota bacterium]